MGSANFLFAVLVATSLSLVGADYGTEYGAGYGDYPTANLSAKWINKASPRQGFTFTDGTTVRVIVVTSPKPLQDWPDPYQAWSFAAGFFCTSPCDVFLFSVFILRAYTGGMSGVKETEPHVVWSANRASPVRENATIELDRHGDLVLRDFDGKVVWSSGTSGKSVAGMQITMGGNLVLFDKGNATVWQSFDHPTDTLLPGQLLREGMSLTANTSATNSTQSQFYITLLQNGLNGYVESTPPQLYFSYSYVLPNETINDPTTATFMNTTLMITVQDVYLPPVSSSQYIRLESDGHLRLHQWSDGTNQWTPYDVMQMFCDRDYSKICREFLIYGDCAYPTVCGEYGICANGQCTCPLQSNTKLNYFKPVDERKANLGCTPLTPISCQDMQHHELFPLADVSYFDKSHTIGQLNRNQCTQACLKNCSCRAVVFRYGQNDSVGECFWVTKVLSLQSVKLEAVHYNSTAYLKVQLSPSNSTSPPALAIALPATSILVLLVIIAILYLRRRRKYEENDDDSELDQLSSGTPTRFSFEKLRECTEG